MLAKLSILALCISAISCTSCVPNPSTFYWTSPCSGQKWANLVQPTDIACYQNNQTLDSLGGIDCTQDLVCVITITNNYDKTVTTPLVDIALQDYAKPAIGDCKWENVPTFGVLNNLDTCDFVQNCHFDSPPDPTQFVVDINIYDVAGAGVDLLNVGDYYGISLTFKDGKDTNLACAYVQDKLLKTKP